MFSPAAGMTATPGLPRGLGGPGGVPRPADADVQEPAPFVLPQPVSQLATALLPLSSLHSAFLPFTSQVPLLLPVDTV
jgi:hypothetical protein